MSGHAKAAGADIRSQKKWHVTGNGSAKTTTVSHVLTDNEAELLLSIALEAKVVKTQENAQVAPLVLSIVGERM